MMMTTTTAATAAPSKTAASSICASGSPADPLPVIRDAAGNVTCLPGFRCPHLDPSNASTYPVTCLPTPQCAVMRLSGRPCELPQSLFEPQLCASGSYCASAAAVELVCPAGSFCPAGSVAPVSCPPLSVCPEGSSKPRVYGPLIATALLYAVVAAVRHAYLSRWRLRGAVHAHSQQQQPQPPRTVATRSGRSDSSNDDAVPMFLFPPSDAAPLLLRAPLLVDPSAFSRSASDDGDEEDMAALRPQQRHGTGPSNTDLAQHFRAVSDGHVPIRLDFRDLRVTLPASSSGTGGGRVLLEGVSGSLRPGTVTAIMGPSGAGKTVLLTTLLQRVDPSWRVEGHLEVNKGHGKFADLRSSIGFVPQDDVLHNELTVEANLFYASELRLPAAWPAERKRAMREVVLEALGLLPHRTTPIGTEADRGVSGGQRKRASIGVELASAPLMVLLDEPTSGLDSTTSLELVTALKDIAVAANITIAMVIHQPRVEIWDALDELLILGVGGRTVYKGRQADVRDYFLAQNIAFDPSKNPADVILDAVVQDSAAFADVWNTRTAAQHGASEPVTPLLLAPDADSGFRGASPPQQLALFVMRSFEKQLSDMTAFVVETIVILLCGFVLGNSMGDFILDDAYRPPYAAISPTTFQLLLPQLHMYQLMSLGLAASVAGVNVFGVERPQYFREVPAGLNRAAYFIANVLAALPRVFIVSLVYSSFFTFLANLVVPFQYLYFCVVLCYWGIYGFGACISVTASKQAAPLIASTGAICFAVFNGFINFPEFMQRLTPGFYASQVLQEQHARWIKHWAVDPMASGVTNFKEGRITESFALMVVLGVVLHAIAFALMVLTHRAQQR